MRPQRSRQGQSTLLIVISTLVLYTVVATYRHHATKGRSRLILPTELDGLLENPTIVHLHSDASIQGSSNSGDHHHHHHQHHHHHHKQQALEPQDSLHSNSMSSQQKPILVPYPMVPKIPSRKANAAFVMLVPERDLYSARRTVREIEDRFNRNYEYPYVFLNEVPFTKNFERTMRTMSKAQMTFGTIPKEHWSYPSWISQAEAKKTRHRMRNIIYGGSESYRHMCRYQSGFFFQHEALLPFDYYWRIEPGVKYTCDIDFDPFLYMQDNNKKYGFTISLKEYAETIPTLWNTTKDFMRKNPELLAKDNLLPFISDDDGENYNGCHFWSNFEIADARWLRGEGYTKYFEHLDKAGGFFYERWGDAPVHSIAAALLLPKDQIHFFREIGYYHVPFFNCPADPELQAKCHCDPSRNLNREYQSCTNKFLTIVGGKPQTYLEELDS